MLALLAGVLKAFNDVALFLQDQMGGFIVVASLALKCISILDAFGHSPEHFVPHTRAAWDTELCETVKLGLERACRDGDPGILSLARHLRVKYVVLVDGMGNSDDAQKFIDEIPTAACLYEGQ